MEAAFFKLFRLVDKKADLGGCGPGIDYQQFLRQVKEGLFPCEKAADVYLINKDTPFIRYISLNNYAKENGLPYAKVKRMAESGKIKTAVKASNGRWYIDAAEEPSFR